MRSVAWHIDRPWPDRHVPPDCAGSRLPRQAHARVHRRSARGHAGARDRTPAASRHRAVHDRSLPAGARAPAGPQPPVPRVVAGRATGRFPRRDRVPLQGQGQHRGDGRRARPRRRLRRGEGHHPGGPGGRTADSIRRPDAGERPQRGQRRVPQHAYPALRRRTCPPGGEPRGRSPRRGADRRGSRGRRPHLPDPAPELSRIRSVLPVPVGPGSPRRGVSCARRARAGCASSCGLSRRSCP